MHKITPKSLASFGLIKLSPDITSKLKEAPLVFPQIDMQHVLQYPPAHLYPFSWHQEANSSFRQFISLVAVDQSSNEHRVLNEIFQDPHAISTVKLLQIAHEQHHKKGLNGAGFLIFTEKTFEDAQNRPEIAQTFLRTL